MGIDHSNPYIHSTTVLCDIAADSLKLMDIRNKKRFLYSMCSMDIFPLYIFRPLSPCSATVSQTHPLTGMWIAYCSKVGAARLITLSHMSVFIGFMRLSRRGWSSSTGHMYTMSVSLAFLGRICSILLCASMVSGNGPPSQIPVRVSIL